MEIAKPEGLILYALYELSEKGKTWVKKETIYKFADAFYTSFDEGDIARDLAVYDDNGWIKNKTGSYVSLEKRGKKMMEESNIPEETKERFYESLKKARNSALKINTK